MGVRVWELGVSCDNEGCNEDTYGSETDPPEEWFKVQGGALAKWFTKYFCSSSCLADWAKKEAPP